MPPRLRLVALLLGLALLVPLFVLLQAPSATSPDAGGPEAAGTPRGATAATATATAPSRPAHESEPLLERQAVAGTEKGTTGARAEDEADPPLLLAACDPSLRPLAGVTLALRVGEPGATRHVWRGSTGTDGLARVPLPRALLQKSRGPVAGTVLLPLRPPVSVPLDRDALPTSPVRVVLPATGQVVVWIDDLGATEAQAVTVSLDLPEDGPGGGSVTEAAGHPTSGSITFPHVGLGLALVVRAERAGQSEAARVSVNGPATPGEVVHVRVRVRPPPDRVVLVMHLRDQKGAALAGHRVQVALEARGPGGVTSTTLTMTADDEGTLRLVADESFRARPERALRLRSRQSQAPTTEAVVTIPATLVPGDNDLGVVALLPPPLVCSGVVVDHAGKPVPAASLSVQVRPAAAGRPGAVRDVRGVRGESDASGRFSLHGQVPAGDLLLAVSATGHLPKIGVPFVLGSDGLRVALDAAASLAGSVRLDEVVTAPDVLVELRAGGAAQFMRVRELGEFRFDSLAPGPAAVAVRLLGEAEGLVVDGLMLRPAEVTRDPRLHEIDLTNGRSVVRFTVLDPEGQPAKDARVAVLHGPDQTSFEGYMLSGGKGRIVTRVRPLEVLVFGDGYRSVRVPGLVDGATVRLPALPRVRLRLPEGCAAPAAPLALEALLQPKGAGWPDQVSYRFFEGLGNETSGDGTPPWLQSVQARLGASGEAVLTVPAPATWALHWRLVREERADRWLANDPATITVRDAAGEQLVTAGVRAEQIEAARARLEGR